MKKFILMSVFALFSAVCLGQTANGFMNFGRYEVVDSLPLENIMIHFNKEVDNEDFIELGDGDYLAPLPHKDKMVVRYNADRTKAIIIYNSYAFGRHLEFDVKDDERRIVFYHKDNNIYCGYVYDKVGKVCKYFESKKEFNRFMRRHPVFHPRFQ